MYVGPVRAGQWSQRAIINDGLAEGSQLPYIERALRRGYAVLVLNANQRQDLDGADDDPEAHAEMVWRELVAGKDLPRHVAVIAFSYGAHLAVRTAMKFPRDFAKRVFSLTLLDPVRTPMCGISEKLRKRLQDITICYVASDKELGIEARTSVDS